MNTGEEIPVYAKAVFVVYPEEILEDLTYFYHDPSRVYHGLLEMGVLNGELEFIKNNMQLFLDQDIFMVNGLEKRLVVEDVSLSFLEGDFERPCLHFKIRADVEFFQGENRLEMISDEEKAPYDFRIVWDFSLLEGSKIVEVKSKLSYKIDREKSKIFMKAFKDKPCGGHEVIKVLLVSSF